MHAGSMTTSIMTASFLRQGRDWQSRGAGQEKGRNPYDHFNLSSSCIMIIVGEYAAKLKCF
jgi:hypothetical protein